MRQDSSDALAEMDSTSKITPRTSVTLASISDKVQSYGDGEVSQVYYLRKTVVLDEIVQEKWPS